MCRTSQSAKAQQYLCNFYCPTASAAISSDALRHSLVKVVRCNTVATAAQTIGRRLVALLISEDDKDAGRFDIALLRPPHCLPGRHSINMHQPICTGSLMMAEELKSRA